MDPIEFPEQTSKLAKNQPEYRVLPIAVRPTGVLFDDPKQFTCKYKLSEIELAQIIKTQCVFISQFGHGFQPIMPQIESPFAQLQVVYEKTDGGIFNAWVPVKSGKAEMFTSVNPLQLIAKILDTFQELSAENLFFVEKPKMAIDEAGGLIKLD